MNTIEIIENQTNKYVKSKKYNYTFNIQNGYFCRWGETFKNNPEYAPSPEILDMEISTVCNNGCKFCYKSNTGTGINMSFVTFKNIFHKLPRTLTQIAFGIGDISANPDLFKILEYCRNNDYQYIVPNITINGKNMTNELYDKLANILGAIAVSHYNDNDCFNAVKQLTDREMKQVNIHKLLAKETYQSCFDLIDKVCEDERLSKLNAIVFLYLKPKGNRNTLSNINGKEDMKRLVEYAFKKNVSIGFDSCSAPVFLNSIHPDYNSKFKSEYKNLKPLVEPCESTLFSYYINANGIGYPCSFVEDEVEEIDIKTINNFNEVWYNDITVNFRNKLIDNKDCHGCRLCPQFDIY